MNDSELLALESVEVAPGHLISPFADGVKRLDPSALAFNARWTRLHKWTREDTPDPDPDSLTEAESFAALMAEAEAEETPPLYYTSGEACLPPVARDWEEWESRAIALHANQRIITLADLEQRASATSEALRPGSHKMERSEPIAFADLPADQRARLMKPGLYRGD